MFSNQFYIRGGVRCPDMFLTEDVWKSPFEPGKRKVTKRTCTQKKRVKMSKASKRRNR